MPWKRDDFADLLDKPDRGYLVAESAGRIVGGAAYRNIAGDVEITNVEIKEGYRGRGLSKMLLKELIKTGRSIGGKQFTLEVRAGNMPAIALYESLGFVREGIRPGFYEQPREDAIIMWLH
jgi:ribosomal-protein-alanine acetyltransferase